MKKFLVEGTITFSGEVEIEADSKEAAYEKFQEAPEQIIADLFVDSCDIERVEEIEE